MNSQDGLSVIPMASTIKGLSQDQLVTSSSPNPSPNSNPNKKKRNLPGTPVDPDAEIIAMSPKSLMATNRFICEICNKGFQRDQNLQLHRRGHNLPWKLKQRNKNEVIRKKVYICPEKSCVHNDPCRALGDLTGIKKHYSRKHGEKKWKCEKCSKKYAVQSDWKAHSKICGTREYKCDCGTLFSRKDSFITHRAFCDALAEENGRFSTISATNPNFINVHNNFTNNNINLDASSRSISQLPSIFHPEFSTSSDQSVLGNNLQNIRPNTRLPLWLLDPAASNNSQLNSNAFVSANNSTTLPSHPDQLLQATPMNMFGLSSNSNLSQTHQWLNNKLPEGIIPWNNVADRNNLSISSFPMGLKEEQQEEEGGKGNGSSPLAHMSATALLQKATQMGSSSSNPSSFFNSRSTSTFGLMNTFNDFVTPLSSNLTPTTTLGDGSFMFSTSFLGNNLDMQSSANLKQDKVVLGENTTISKENETRDFLGVGGETTSGSFFQQELAKFVSMGDLTHYTTGHH